MAERHMDGPAGPANPGATSAWDTGDIDRYMCALAAEAVDRIPEHWGALTAAALRQSNNAPTHQTREIWEMALGQGPDWLKGRLLSPDQLGHGLRRLIPFHALIPKVRRIELLRDTALNGRFGNDYISHWNSVSLHENALVDLVSSMVNSLDEHVISAFSDFVTLGGRTKWIIAADFCIGDDDRVNDVFAFTILSVDGDVEAILAQIAAIFPRDLKKTKEITPDMISYLRSPSRFHFSFVVSRPRSILGSLEDVRKMIDHTLTMMHEYPGAEDHAHDIAMVKALRQEANARSFNIGLFQDTILMTTFAAFIALLLQIEGRAELIGFMPDRDDMTTSNKGIAYLTFALNSAAYAAIYRLPEARIMTSLPGPREGERTGLYYDEFIRIPDYIAGVTAAADFSANCPSFLKEKHEAIARGAFVDNDNIVILSMDVLPRPFSLQRIVLGS